MMSMRLMLRSPLMLVMAVFFVVRINLELAGVLLAAIPILGFSVFFILRQGFPFFLKVQQKVDQLNEVVRENLINIRVVKSFVREDFEAHKFKDKSESLRDTVIHASNIIVSIFPVMQLVMNLSIIAILWMGGHKVMTGELKVGELISFGQLPGTGVDVINDAFHDHHVLCPCFCLVETYFRGTGHTTFADRHTRRHAEHPRD